MPSLNGSIGVQGIGTGNPGYSLTGEKNWRVKGGSFNAFAGVGYRSNEDHLHSIGGMKYQWNSGLAVGIQLDGHDHNPFVIQNYKNILAGIYWIDATRPAFIIGARF